MCPWNEKFARALPDESPFAPREAIGAKDGRMLAREILTMSRDDYVARFRRSPLKRPKLRGLQRNAVVVLGNTGTAADAPALVAALSSDEPLVRGHAAWALGRIGTPAAAEALRARVRIEPDDGVRQELRAALAALGA